MAQEPASWMNDPFGRYQLRYWDGSQWTAHVSTNGEQSVDPMGNTAFVPFATPHTAAPWPAPDPASRHS
jgi:hypothetical protein